MLSCLLGVAATSAANAALSPLEMPAPSANHLDLAPTSSMISYRATLPFLDDTDLARMKHRAAVNGLVLMASIGVDAKPAAIPQKSQRMQEAEATIANLNDSAILSALFVLAGTVMWGGVAMQRRS